MAVGGRGTTRSDVVGEGGAGATARSGCVGIDVGGAGVESGFCAVGGAACLASPVFGAGTAVTGGGAVDGRPTVSTISSTAFTASTAISTHSSMGRRAANESGRATVRTVTVPCCRSSSARLSAS
jgi:hypothetical protein